MGGMYLAGGGTIVGRISMRRVIKPGRFFLAGDLLYLEEFWKRTISPLWR